MLLTMYARSHSKRGAKIPWAGGWFGHREVRRPKTEAELVAHLKQWAAT